MQKFMIIILSLLLTFGLAGCNQHKQLTLNKVIALSEKGNELTWSDFEQYESVQTGSGLFILKYDIDDVFALIIGGAGTGSPPMYIRLVLKEDFGKYVDIRTGDVKSFIDANMK